MLEVVAQRARRLGAGAVQTLGVAAVIGRSFDLELVADVLEAPEHEVLDVLEQAVATSLLREHAQEPGSFTFAHALVEHALYASLSAARRAHLHGRVGESIERLYGSAAPERVLELAHHFAAAVRPSAPGKAIDYACRAGRRAIEQLAPAEGCRWFTRGLELVDQFSAPDDPARCELLIGLGEAQRQSGAPDFRRTLLDAAGLARSLGDGHRVARAVLATSRGLGSVSRPDEELISLLRAASESLAETDPLRPRVMALLAAELTFTSDVGTRRALVQEAVELARAQADPHTLAFVLLYYVFALWFPDTLAERLEPSAEMVAAAQAAGDPPLLFHAAARHWTTMMEAGDLDQAERCMEIMRGVVKTTPQPMLRWRLLYYSATRELLAGRLDDAEARATQSLEVGSAAGEADAAAFHAALTGFIRWEQGALAQALGFIDDALARFPAFNIFQPLRALALCEADRRQEAAALLSEGTANHFAAIPANALWASAMLTWSHVAARVGDRDAAAALFERLQPFADQVAVTPVGAPGAIAHGLGLLASTHGRPALAEQYFSQAIAVHERLRAPLLIARARGDRAALALSQP
ncbi:MAG: hypothetical protein DLM64_00215 [Solirubrobacterales bacterium]|nr:MAG: hypothetical protein DLM64_00215 [Solirubrobacterales bacterium]